VLGPITQLTRGTAQDHSGSISADGKRMVFESDRTGIRVVWTKDLETGQERALTTTPSTGINQPRISPDGASVAYAPVTKGARRLYVVPFEGGTPREVAEGGAIDWTPDGRLIHQPDPNSVIVLDVRTGAKQRVLQRSAHPLYAQSVSPDGRWILFGTVTADHIGTNFVARFRDHGEIPEKDWIPTRGWAWSPDGNRIWGAMGRDGFQCIWTQRLDPTTKRMVGEPEPAYHLHGATRSLGSPSGLGVAADKAIFTLVDQTGNIWMAEPERQ
jgi:dipeptidyl aminopeptidase/acylaminoacyl peptidase